jgi:hypothetical protein
MTVNAVWCLSPNFGDAITPWLIPKIRPCRVVWRPMNTDVEHYIISGSIANWANEKSVVWGAGLASFKDDVNGKARFLAVRGPLTRYKIMSVGGKCPPVYGDPAILLPKFYTPKGNRPKAPLGIIPHYVDQPRVFPRYPRDGSVKIINILDPVESVIEDVVSCERIASSALHGLIVADAYGIPNLWAKFSDSVGGDGMKFLDYFMSAGRPANDVESCYLDCRGGVDGDLKWWSSQKFELGHLDPDPLMAFCPFDPKGDPAGAQRKYLS